jgi:hypothetical protein
MKGIMSSGKRGMSLLLTKNMVRLNTSRELLKRYVYLQMLHEDRLLQASFARTCMVE